MFWEKMDAVNSEPILVLNEDRGLGQNGGLSWLCQTKLNIWNESRVTRSFELLYMVLNLVNGMVFFSDYIFQFR